MRTRHPGAIPALALAAGASVVAALAMGSVNVPLRDTTPMLPRLWM